MTSRKNRAGQPAGWYPDPSGQPMLRWWDGSRWGEQTQPAPPPGAMEHLAAPQTASGHPMAQPPAAAKGARRRPAFGIVIVTIVLIAAGFAVAVPLLSSPPAGPLVVQGRVTGVGGKPVSGIKVWLNALPPATLARGGQGPVTVVGSATTSATGRYALRVPSLSALAPDAINGIVKFSVMTGNSTGWDMSSFSRSLSGGTTTVILHLMPPA